MIPLLTSMPPGLKRPLPDGRDAGDDYQRACIASWSRAGFDPVSVNARRELAQALPRRAGVRYVEVADDALETTGKPLVRIRDLIRVARELSTGPFAITNADILFEGGDDLFRAVRELTPGRMIVAKRFDVDAPDAQTAVEYSHGIDFFAFHRDDVVALDDTKLVFGAPWWDHCVPLRMVARGVRIEFLRSARVVHLSHEERWRRELWLELGADFLDEVRGAFSPRRRVDTEESRRYAERFRGATSIPLPEHLRLWRRHLREGVNWRKAWSIRAEVLGRVSDANVRFIDELRARTAPPAGARTGVREQG